MFFSGCGETNSKETLTDEDLYTPDGTEPTDEEQCSSVGGDWNNTECTRTVNCAKKPEKTEWNDGKTDNESGKFTQTWNGTEWLPKTLESEYSEETGDCKYKCQDGYFRKMLNIGNICTGQNECYDDYGEKLESCPSSGEDFYGQDAQYANKCRAHSFTAVDEIVYDDNTGLTWELSPSDDVYTWEKAHLRCDNLNNANFAGKSNWRVPNPLELMTLVDNDRINGSILAGNYSNSFWTNQQYTAHTESAYIFDVYMFRYYDKSDAFRVLCVSGNEMRYATSSDFTVSADGKTVTDRRTGLIWQKTYGPSGSWPDALAYCQNLNSENSGAYSSGWKLPSINELLSLLDLSKSEPPYSNFPEIKNYRFWASSTSPYNRDAWALYLDSGIMWETQKSFDAAHGCGALCVRNPDYDPVAGQTCVAADEI